TLPSDNRDLRNAWRVGAHAARVLQKAFGDGPCQLSPPPCNATGVPRPAKGRSGCCQRIRSRKTTRLLRSRSLRRQVPRYIRRVALCHLAARLKFAHNRILSCNAKGSCKSKNKNSTQGNLSAQYHF